MTCPDCSGTGVTFEDFADRRGEHSTRELPCPSCSDDTDGDDSLDPCEPEGEETGIECAGEVRE